MARTAAAANKKKTLATASTFEKLGTLSPKALRSRLQEFFRRCDPSRVAQVESLAQSFESHQSVLWAAIDRRYPNKPTFGRPEDASPQTPSPIPKENTLKVAILPSLLHLYSGNPSVSVETLEQRFGVQLRLNRVETILDVLAYPSHLHFQAIGNGHRVQDMNAYIQRLSRGALGGDGFSRELFSAPASEAQQKTASASPGLGSIVSSFLNFVVGEVTVESLSQCRPSTLAQLLIRAHKLEWAQSESVEGFFLSLVAWKSTMTRASSSSVRIFLGCFVPKFGRLLFLGMLAYVKAFGENHKLLPKALCVIAGVVLFGDRLAVLVGEPPSSISPSSSHVRLRTQIVEASHMMEVFDDVADLRPRVKLASEYQARYMEFLVKQIGFAIS